LLLFSAMLAGWHWLPPFQVAQVASAPADTPALAPGDIYPRDAHERELCARASYPDWYYLEGLAALDVAAILFSSLDVVNVKGWGSYPSLVGPLVLGTAWGMTVGGAWLALPKCSPSWVSEPGRDGDVRETWPLAISLALLAGATAPVLNAIVVGSNSLPQEWSTLERELHVIAAGLAGFGGAFLPYLIPPRTWRASRELERIRFGVGVNGSVFFAYRF
jgi:hypothetical protein